jgi:outer membrane protein TolC
MRSNQLRLEARQTLANLTTLRAKVEVANLETQLAHENLQVDQAQYTQGKILLVELEAAQREESSRWIGYLDVKLEQEKSRLSLFKQTGLYTKEIQ